MKAKELTSYWASPDNSRLTAKQYSLRLPIHVAAKISALCDMYADKTRTEIIGDLLSTVLEDVENSFEFVEGEVIAEHPETGEIFHDDIGLRSTFSTKAKHYEKELENELEQGNDK